MKSRKLLLKKPIQERFRSFRLFFLALVWICAFVLAYVNTLVQALNEAFINDLIIKGDITSRKVSYFYQIFLVYITLAMLFVLVTVISSAVKNYTKSRRDKSSPSISDICKVKTKDL